MIKKLFLALLFSSLTLPVFAQTDTATETATQTQTATFTSTQTATNTRTATQTATSTRTATNTKTATNTRTATATQTQTATATRTQTRTATQTQTATVTATVTPSIRVVLTNQNIYWTVVNLTAISGSQTVTLPVLFTLASNYIVNITLDDSGPANIVYATYTKQNGSVIVTVRDSSGTPVDCSGTPQILSLSASRRD